ncbi:uncharacterized protein IL334_005576 [Kwoniella shivajii]|uniref:F-box domain-containing protein n=1 Tax=Kwoniella shivajii TaxID=564305 RepID=A0ABZ1D3V2_9TREE|nr:hypothetical protein IL334_005576 [Kwoniella shivajii]
MSPTIIDLPEEILLCITSYLDRSACLSLATTCKALQPSAESSAWTHLNLSLYGSDQSSMGNIIFGKQLKDARGTWPRLLSTVSFPCATSFRVTNLMADIRILLYAHPRWLRSVRTISVDIDTVINEPLQELLVSLSGSLNELEFKPPYHPCYPNLSCSQMSLTQLFEGMDKQLTSLRRLHLTLNNKWQDTVQAALLCAPMITCLKLTPESIYCGGWEKKMFFEEPDEREWPRLPHLRRIEVEEMYEQMASMLASLIQTSDQVEHLILGDPVGRWAPKSENPLIQQLSRLDSLKTLTISARPLEALAAIRKDIMTEIEVKILDPVNEC